ncbi:PREDICTED: caspase-12-like isoform X2 [Hipposideros armiger]|uniref:Caspase-12-like isoform X2 n=1 Tax=Hipposideros armiger TaxID=186990 RepID=A0A8B7QNB0_HIPAR|nr:PREDICTED: caspase-12-like isoform X2 [Hipposideros armiger]
MADKRPKEDPMNKVKSIAKNFLDNIFDDLMENNVLNELQRLGKGVTLLVEGTENLAENIAEKSQTASKRLVERLFKEKPSLDSHSKSEDDESENSETSSSSSAESEDESEENRDEKKAESAMALALPPSESEDESEENRDEKKAESAMALALPPSAPQKIQAFEPSPELKLCSYDYFHRMKTTKADEIYPVMEQEGRTRLALIICNKEFKHLSYRDSSEIDLKGMKELLENLGYSVVVKEDITAREMEEVLWEFAARPEHQSSDSTILVFMSHGTLEGIYGTLHQKEKPDILHDDTIFRIFNNRNCQNLRDKPKVIITQACRGSTGATWVADSGEAPACRYDHTFQCYFWSDAVTQTHVEKDFIAFKSSTPHNMSWRTEIYGSLFISQLIYHLKEYSWCYHLEEIFRKVQRSFENVEVLAQMPTIERVTMTRYFYLFPGI